MTALLREQLLAGFLPHTHALALAVDPDHWLKYLEIGDTLAAVAPIALRQA